MDENHVALAVGLGLANSALSRIRAILYAAKLQRSASDDKIIADRIEEAYAIADEALLRDRTPRNPRPSTVASAQPIAEYGEGASIVNKAQESLNRALSDGERRDLLKDNTRWSNETVDKVVRLLRYGR